VQPPQHQERALVDQERIAARFDEQIAVR